VEGEKSSVARSVLSETGDPHEEQKRAEPDSSVVQAGQVGMKLALQCTAKA
jgi:hypothetical protein